jgi:DNA modification methylase
MPAAKAQPKRRKVVVHSEEDQPQRWSSRIVGEAEVDPRKLIPNPQNWRKHPKAQQVALEAALDEVGWIQRVIVNQRTGHMIDGHLRVERALAQHEHTVPVSYVDLTPEQEAIALATFDPLGALATTDQKILDALLRSIDCDNEDLAQLLAHEPDEDESTGAGGESGSGTSAGQPITRPGDLWALGEHRLLCGDCRSERDLAKLFGDTRINVAITSPPYAAQRDYDKSSGFKPILPDDYVQWFAGVSEGIADYLVEDGSFFLNIKEHCEDGQRVLYVKDLTLAHVRDWHWRLVDELIWVHGGTPKAVINRFKNAWEPIFHFTRSETHKFRPERVRHESDSIRDFGGEHPSNEKPQGGRSKAWNIEKYDGGSPCDADKQGVPFKSKKRLTIAQKKIGSANVSSLQGDSEAGKLLLASIYESIADAGGLAYPSNVLSLGKNREALGHSAAFPVALPEFFLMAFSDKGDVVFDPFMGSGSTLIAAELHKRRAYGTEISPAYCDIIINRWQLHTGQRAKLVQP